MPSRNYVLHGVTVSFCPLCQKRISAKIIIREGKVFLLKYCPEHGEREDLLEEDATYYLSRDKFEKPGTTSKTQTAIDKGCPFDCGLCPDHDQHTCIGLIEITERCNLGCPVCYAYSGKGKDLEFEKISKMMDFFQESEGGKAEILQISGGEPTLHPRILDIIALAKEKKFRYVMLNTNGLRIANEPDFAKSLQQFRGGFELYLQFDTFSDENYMQIRGRKLVELRKKAVDNLALYNVPTTLVATIENGRNDGELGEIIAYAMEKKNIRGINFQPIAFFGRLRENHDMSKRLTLTGVLKRIEEQTKGTIKTSDFIPLPCDTDRVAITYLIKSGSSFLPITRKIKVENYLEFLDNTLVFKAEEMMSAAKNRTFSLPICDCLPFLRDMSRLLPKNFSKQTTEERMEFVDNNTFRITVTSFVDMYNFEAKAMKKECVHIITPDLKRIPFSAYNMIHRPEISR